MKKEARYKSLIAHFSAHHPHPKTELHHNSPYELLVAVILSAQCTDKRVNKTTPTLFARFPNPYSLANASTEEVFTHIRSISYPHNKARYLVGMAKQIVTHFGGNIPKNTTDLQSLIGIGRKSAHVIASALYGKSVIAVDTHVTRVSKRLGLVSPRAKTPLAIEKELTKNLPPKYRADTHNWLVLHGRYICTARKPKCNNCPLQTFCYYFQKQVSIKKTHITKNNTY